MAAIIFDFDGTIADSFDFVVAFLERHVRRGHLLEPEEKEKLRGMTMHRMAMHLGCPRWRLPILFIIGRYSMGRVIYNVPLFEGMGKVIEEIHAEGHTLVIVSSNNTRNIKKFLKQHHLYKYFTSIYGDAGFFGKARKIRKAVRRGNFTEAESLYVGDEVRDILAARGANIRVVSVSWGFDTADLLAQAKPDAIAHKRPELMGILEEM